MTQSGVSTAGGTEQPAARTGAHHGQEGLLRRFRAVRQDSETLCALLAIEDHVVQPAPYVSPPKWHLAHTTWFFDRFLLQPAGIDSLKGLPGANLMFNSYYKSQGTHWLQENRGHLSRPAVSEVLDWRQEVTARLGALLEGCELSEDQRHILTIGIAHEQQHQELLLMDIKYILAGHPWAPALDGVSVPPVLSGDTPMGWLEVPEGLREFGAGPDGFAYDNEKPRHRHWLASHQLADRLVNNADFLAFVEDDGYRRPELWLSDGWDWLQQQGIEHPLYWRREEGQWWEYHLGGLSPLQPGLPLSHVSRFEADAFARWSGARLPTEFELERMLEESAADTSEDRSGWTPGESVCPAPDRAADSLGNGLLWQWSSSTYAPYPGFRPEAGALGEYNGKFMNNQYVLRGGCVATPRQHLRPSYRNFFRSGDRWAFTGIRLAKD